MVRRKVDVRRPAWRVRPSGGRRAFAKFRLPRPGYIIRVLPDACYDYIRNRAHLRRASVYPVSELIYVLRTCLAASSFARATAYTSAALRCMRIPVNQRSANAYLPTKNPAGAGFFMIRGLGRGSFCISCLSRKGRGRCDLRADRPWRALASLSRLAVQRRPDAVRRRREALPW